MSGTSPTRIYVCENLTVGTWLRSVFPYLFRSRSTPPPNRLYFIDASRLGLVLARLTAWTLRAIVQELEFQLIDVRDDGGDLIEERLRFVDLFEAQSAALNDPACPPVFRSIPAGSRLTTYLSKGVALSIRYKVLLVQIAAWKGRQEKTESAVLFTDRQPWLSPLQTYASRHGVELVGVLPPWSRRNLTTSSSISGDWRDRTRARHRLKPETIESIRILYYRLFYWWGRFRSGARAVQEDAPYVEAEPEASSVPKVALDQRGQVRLDRPELNSDLFFVQQSSLAAKDILVFLNSPVEPEPVRSLLDRETSIVALHPRAALASGVPLYLPRSHHSPSRAVLRPSVGSNGEESLWTQDQIVRFGVLRDYWVGLFESSRAKVFCSWGRFDAQHSAIAEAMRDVGGVFAVYPRALNPMPSPLTTIDVDVCFNYGTQSASVEKLSGSRIRYNVVVGFIGDHRFELLRPQARQLRDSLEKNGATRILAYLDENSARDSRWHTGHEFMRHNYEFLLTKVLENPWLGVVIKPKAPSTLRSRLGPVAEILERAEATRRCQVYDRGTDTGMYPPAAATLCADVAVHGHLVAGTAGLESALTGVPTLLLDREGWSRSPLQGLGPNVVFRDWEDLWESLTEHWSSDGGKSGLGDWSLMLDDLDPFRDGRAAERMGTFIGWVLDGFKAHRDRETALADAAERYCDEWGSDWITAVNIDLPPADSVRIAKVH